MVVMEYIDGETLHEVKRVPPSAKEEVACALEILHDKNYAFGDLRWQNVMIMRNEKVKLVDFDWAGKENETRYPLLASRAITGPLGVEGGSLIKKSHNIHMCSPIMPTSVSILRSPSLHHPSVTIVHIGLKEKGTNVSQ